ncbi:LysE family translocator [Anaeromicrobium sediminis]|uniref:Threonine transporter RhtB n=1 Tax=Anaeromicrobium sediminis TaxID=1478221 RepID=A0A267MK48_9FIRM|nr:LysE family translocator [Anaeromicrobium sediminis]PAB59792.1 threonine transporter RhtB [Anaeromicrobium sediminis]
MEFSKIFYFLSVSIVLTLAPGPDNLFVMIQSITQGKKAGIATSLGLCTGVLFHTTAAALGISAIIYKSALMFKLVKYLGAFYLIYLAYKAYKDKNEILHPQEGEKLDSVSLYKKGVIMNILNPKVSLFFLAFLPQFINESGRSIPLQMVFLGLVFIMQALLIFTIICLFSEKLGEKIMHNENIWGKIGIVKSLVFTMIGLKMAID